MKPMKLVVKDHKHQLKPFSATGKKLVRVDSRTCIYVPEKATAKQVKEAIAGFLSKYNTTYYPFKQQ